MSVLLYGSGGEKMKVETSYHSITQNSPVPEIFKIYLKNRGIDGDESISRFLFPQLVDLPTPDKMQNLNEASDLVVKYMDEDKQIIVWGDYDVDGTTGTALLVNFFRECGVSVLWHIPNRLNECYGLNVD